MKYVIYLVLLLSSVGSVVGAEAQTPDDKIDGLIAQLVDTNPNKRYIHDISKLDNNEGIEGWIAFKQRSNDGTQCPFCEDSCTLHQLSEHVESNCTKSISLGGHLCLVIPTEDDQQSHYCLSTQEDTVTKTKIALDKHELAAFVHWCAPGEE